MSHPAITEDYIAMRLIEAYEPPHEETYPSAALSDAPLPAAVLVPLLRKKTIEEYSWHILLTRRSNSLAEHRGQVAFPGGRSDPNDTTPYETALREAHEEIGLHPDDVRILGKLNSLVTITNYCVTPVVCAIPWPYSFRLARREVSRVFTIPIRWLSDPANHEMHQRILPFPYARMLQADRLPVIYFRPYDNEVLWGVSAEITLRLINVLFNKKFGGR